MWYFDPERTLANDVKSGVEPRPRDQPKSSSPVGHARSRPRGVSARDEAAGLRSERSWQRRSVQGRRAREFRGAAARTTADPGAPQVSPPRAPRLVVWLGSRTRRVPIPRTPVFGPAD